jgi:hypothetical protein
VRGTCLGSGATTGIFVARHTDGWFIEINDDELVMHTGAATARRLLGKWFGNVLCERSGEYGRDIAIRLLEIDPADLFVGNAIDEDVVVFRNPFNGVQDDTGRFIQKRQRIEKAGRGIVADVIGDLLQHRIRRSVWRESDACVDVLEAEVPQLGRMRPECGLVIKIIIEGIQEQCR